MENEKCGGSVRDKKNALGLSLRQLGLTLPNYVKNRLNSCVKRLDLKCFIEKYSFFKYVLNVRKHTSSQ